MKVDLELARGIFASAPFMVDLGVVPTAVGDGTVSTELRVERRHTQHTGVVHAGVMATMAVTAPKA